jgi:flagellum-specific peptidoglycan hydrolase FlgJ
MASVPVGIQNLHHGSSQVGGDKREERSLSRPKREVRSSKVTPQQISWVFTTASAAYSSNHIYPRMAACEAAVESGYGTSQLFRLANNVFGLKQCKHPTYPTLSLPTKEYENGGWIVCSADWVEYPSLMACFKDRMATLMRLRSIFPEYQKALTSPTPEEYVTAVSSRWSTDPLRAAKCIEIFHAIWPITNATEVQDAAAGSN